MRPEEVVAEVVKLHDLAGEELLRGRLHRAKAYILDALRVLREAAERGGVKSVVEDAERLYREIYGVDPRAATAAELDRHRWELHRLVEDYAFATLSEIDGVVEVPVGGWVDEAARSFAREFVNAKKRLEEVGMIAPEDRGISAYVVGGVAYVKVGSAPEHAASLRYDPKLGGYVLRYYDRDRPILKTFKKLAPGRVVGEGRDYVEVLVDRSDLQKAARALALMASEDIRRDVLYEFFNTHPADKGNVAAAVFARHYKKFVETGEPPRFNIGAARLLTGGVYEVLARYEEVKKMLKEFAAGRHSWEDVSYRILDFLAYLTPIYIEMGLGREALLDLSNEVRYGYVYEDLTAEMPEAEARRAAAKRYISTLNRLVRPVMRAAAETGALLEERKKAVLRRVYAEPPEIEIPGFKSYLKRRAGKNPQPA